MLRFFDSGATEIFSTSNPPYAGHLPAEQWDVSSLNGRLPSASENPMFYVGVYAALNILGVVFQLTSTALQYVGALRASRVLFK
jgi:hypothetical protein